MTVTTYLNFNGRCEEALNFYTKTIGAKVGMMMRFKESPEKNPNCTPANENKIMHSAFTVGETTLMATDGMLNGQKVSFDGFSLSLYGKDKAAVEKQLAALGEGGSITMPASETFFAHSFGMVKDKFGVNWMVLAPKQM
ncbi:MAG: VOC family protein [Pseudolabrys sp.]|nr:VOC family protein [Pseudolabrys sp.]